MLAFIRCLAAGVIGLASWTLFLGCASGEKNPTYLNQVPASPDSADLKVPASPPSPDKASPSRESDTEQIDPPTWNDRPQSINRWFVSLDPL
ncbi:MAG TPA: hypothetical protein VHP11_13105 [Tepidisphaeraceae bacterium]|nr:hypothetical protein [Tepidisphaeraceae bacterium]